MVLFPLPGLVCVAPGTAVTVRGTTLTMAMPCTAPSGLWAKHWKIPACSFCTARITKPSSVGWKTTLWVCAWGVEADEYCIYLLILLLILTDLFFFNWPQSFIIFFLHVSTPSCSIWQMATQSKCMCVTQDWVIWRKVVFLCGWKGCKQWWRALTGSFSLSLSASPVTAMLPKSSTTSPLNTHITLGCG